MYSYEDKIQVKLGKPVRPTIRQLHTVIGTAANVNDVTQAGALLHGQEKEVFGDAG